MELRHLRYFVEIAKHLSFTQAAERVHVTQSTLSHQIRQLEEELGVTLFERDGRKLHLTWSGQLFLPAAQKALQDLDQAAMSLKQQSSQVTGRLCIGASQTLDLEVIPSSVALFLRKHPDVQISVHESSADVLVTKVADGSFDLAVTYNPYMSDELDFEPLCSEELVLVMGPAHPLAQRRRVRVAELHALEVAMLNPRFATRQLIDGVLANAGVTPRVVVDSMSVPMLLRLVASSPLCTILSRLSVSASSGLCIVPLEAPTPIRVSGVIWPALRPRTREMVEFAAILRTVIGDMSAKVGGAA